MSIIEWMDNLNICLYNEYYLVIKRQKILIYLYIMDEPEKHYVVWKKEVEDYILYEFCLYEMSREGKVIGK